jgi:hypothetical protein
MAGPSPLIGWLAALVVSLWTPLATAEAACTQGEEVRIWFSPSNPEPGRTLEIMAVATDGALSDLTVTGPGGGSSPMRTREFGGPPWSLSATLFDTADGTYRIEAKRRGRVVSCREIDVGGGHSGRGAGDFPLRDWDLAAEALYSAWIERLFDAPPEQSLQLPSLQPVLRDPSRNFLFDHLRRGEDAAVPATPDCADLPYFLRWYFAWKMGLPTAYRSCSRGSSRSPPRCGSPVIETAFVRSPASPSDFRESSRRLVDVVHSGSARTALSDEATDFYPVPLQRRYLWPGTLFADPYGHVLVIVKWIPQSGRRSGLLLAVDAQPDNSVGRKRFWEGNFLFASDVPSAGAGFKAFRPLVDARSRPTPAANARLRGDDGRPPFSAEQGRLTSEDFYARMGRLINPAGLDPEAAYEAALDALVEQLEARVVSVDNGERYVRRNPGAVIPMPGGGAIFETTGPWEDYSTPSRDMRLLIAMDVVQGMPGRILRYPELFDLGRESPSRAKARIARLHEKRLNERQITYSRSDGSPRRLSLAEIYRRRPDLEMAYNPNDCVEVRWGAPPGSEEAASCRRHAPREQRARMEQYRLWFRETRRPAR